MKQNLSILLSTLALSTLAFIPAAPGQTEAKFTSLYHFGSVSGMSVNPGGAFPTGTLALDNQKNIFGTTEYGGNAGAGTVFLLTLDGDFGVMHVFSAHDANFDNKDGSAPENGVILGGDGYVYGTTISGGTSAYGTVFQIYIANSLFATLANFSRTTGYPNTPLILDGNGGFYGMTNYGGAKDAGSVFGVTIKGGYSLVASLDNTTTGYGSAGLVRTGDGTLYGLTGQGAANNEGAVFRLTPGDTPDTLYSFQDVDGNVDGQNPSSPLIQGRDGNFYGTSAGGANLTGTIFMVTPEGDESVLYSFSATDDDGHNDDGDGPRGALLLGSDDNFYGTTYYGGANGTGTLFRFTPAGQFTTLYTFSATTYNSQLEAYVNDDGANPQAALAEGKAGLLYGTTYDGGPGGTGTIFELALAPIVTSAQVATGVVGKAFSYQITAADSPTSFGVQGLPAGFSVNAKTGLISATPNAAGKFTLTLNAYGAGGKGSATLLLTIEGVPKITSATSATATVGQAFSYQITASGEPTSFGVQGLPAGFTVNPQTGVISGTPKAAGKVSLTLNAYNAAGKGSAALTLTVQAAPPVITSAATATAHGGPGVQLPG